MEFNLYFSSRNNNDKSTSRDKRELVRSKRIQYLEENNQHGHRSRTLYLQAVTSGTLTKSIFRRALFLRPIEF